MFNPEDILRPHLKTLEPYSSARDDYSGSDGVFLDANENPIGSITEADWNRYPDPYQSALKARIGEIKGVLSEQIFLGNGSDEPIDLLFRAFCEPGADNVIINPPTYGMYKVSADINGVEVKEVFLTLDYDLNVAEILDIVNQKTKIIFVCSPNNPTGNDLSLAKIEKVLATFKGIVVVDEAYIDFADRPSFTTKLAKYPNLVVLQTFSKAWGLASLRLGMAFCSKDIMSILNKIKAPYNLSGLTQQTVLESLSNTQKKDSMVKTILDNRDDLKSKLELLDLVQKVHPTDANFFLVTIPNASKVYQDMIDKRVILRDRSKVALCDDGIRITVGTQEENATLIKALKELEF